MPDVQWKAIYCPGETHREPVRTSKGIVSKSPKILLLHSSDRNEFLIQCSDMRCRHAGRPNYNGWYRIKFRKSGYDITPMRAQHFDTAPVPGVVFQG